jgi:hypothetical protein
MTEQRAALLTMKAIVYVLLLSAVVGFTACSSPRTVHRPGSNPLTADVQEIALTDAIIDAWVRSFPKENLVLFLEPRLLGYSAVDQARASGYVITTLTNRTDDSTGNALEIEKIVNKGPTAEATIVTRSLWWDSMETYKLAQDQRANWTVTSKKTIFVADRAKRPGE